MTPFSSTRANVTQTRVRNMLRKRNTISSNRAEYATYRTDSNILHVCLSLRMDEQVKKLEAIFKRRENS
jgi:hypothetical protein